MKMIEVIYSVKNRSCLSLKPVSFFIFTEDATIARELALIDLKKYTKHWERYAPICEYRELIEV